MAEGTYEFECMRAELLGLEKPDRSKFELERAEILKAQQEQLNAAQAEELSHDDESLNSTGGKIDEINSILSVTQKRLNKFKKTASTSLSNLFKGQSIGGDVKSTSTEKADVEQSTPDINEALNNLEKMESVEKQSDVQVAKNASLDIEKKMTSHLDKLDSLIYKAECAENSMSSQNKQMKRFLK